MKFKLALSVWQAQPHKPDTFSIKRFSLHAVRFVFKCMKILWLKLTLKINDKVVLIPGYDLPAALAGRPQHLLLTAPHRFYWTNKNDIVTPECNWMSNVMFPF